MRVVALAILGFYALICLAVMTGCAGSERVVDTSCTAFTTYTYSASGDSEETKAQIRGHNAAWLALCGK